MYLLELGIVLIVLVVLIVVIVPIVLIGMRMRIKISIGLVKLSNNRKISTPSTENDFIIGRGERVR